ncbi:acylphosphatase-1-like isoform X1 [Lepisosteus oculatus]|uniref:acylphosphatase-1-like isoform X1 n=1 Tax=Lepisosteus oculatus TaxID=7918 RepID=UPI0035F52A81
MSSASGLVSVDYEVFGDVQGVFFRKYTEEQGRRLKLVGWVRNTNRDTVEGQVQGPQDVVEIMCFACRPLSLRRIRGRRSSEAPGAPVPLASWPPAQHPVLQREI